MIVTTHNQEEPKMKRIMLLLPVALLLLLLVTIPAFATLPQEAAGHWTYLPRGDVLLKEPGGNIFLWNVEDAVWTGTFEGESVDTGIVVLHRSGSAFFKGVVVFESATVQGKTGSLELRVNGTKKDLTLDTEWKGYWVVAEAGGELAGLKGQGTWWGPGWQGDPAEWGHIDYDGRIHFE
jgi:hypothetical protein